MPGGVADLLDVGGAEAALHVGDPLGGRLLQPQEGARLNGCIPAVVSSTVGSCEAGTSEAEGTILCPRCSKKSK